MDSRNREPTRLLDDAEALAAMAGAALIEAVRRIRPGLPVLLLSGYLGADVVQRAGRAGADAMLRKPVSRVALAEELAGVLHPMVSSPL